MRRTIQWKPLLFFLIYTFVWGGIGALLGGKMDLSSLDQPPLTPPSWLFPVAWSILYALMAIAAYLVYVSNDTDRFYALKFYLIQVIVNALWTLFFFRLEWRLFAFIWLVILLVLVVFTAVRFKPVSRIAAYLLIPYILWLCFAGYLNLATYLLNA